MNTLNKRLGNHHQDAPSTSWYLNSPCSIRESGPSIFFHFRASSCFGIWMNDIPSVSQDGSAWLDNTKDPSNLSGGPGCCGRHWQLEVWHRFIGSDPIPKGHWKTLCCWMQLSWCFFTTHSLRIQSPSQMVIGVYNHLLRKVFRFHYHSQKVIGSLGI